MNSRSLPKEIDVPQLSSRGRYVYCGHDSSTARQLCLAARQNEAITRLGLLLDEDYKLLEAERLYILTKDRYNTYISSAVAYLGERGLRSVYWLDEDERKEFESDFENFITNSVADLYPHAS